MTEHPNSTPLHILKFNRTFFHNFWTLFKPFWVSEEKNNALLLLAVNAICIMVTVSSTVEISYFNKDFFDALVKLDKTAILVALRHFVFALTFLILSTGYGNYCNSLISICWQRWLTKHYLRKWLSNYTHYQMTILNKNVDNPDQRISEDLQQLTTSTLGIFVSLFQSLLTLSSFGYILWSLSGLITIPIGPFHLVIHGYLCWAALLFAALGTFIIGKIGGKLSNFNYLQQNYTADFRFSLVRLRESSEQIAMSRGEKVEMTKLDGLFSRIYANFIDINVLRKNLMFFTNGYNNIAGIAGILFSLPLYLTKKILLGGVMQISMAFGNVIAAFSVFINTFAELTTWRAVVHRLTEFNEMMDSLQDINKDIIILKNKTINDIIIQHLNLTTPHGKILLEDINLVINRNTSTLLCGPSGHGKSILLRAIAGIWVCGSGEIQLPQDASLIFLPQKPYLPLGSLKEALLYPNNDFFDEEYLNKVLERCLLHKFQDQLNVVTNWSHTLSLGEQQLLAFGRIFLYKPDIICLDESTSGLDEKKESAIYLNVRKYLPHVTVISVGHRSSLYQFHEKIIML